MAPLIGLLRSAPAGSGSAAPRSASSGARCERPAEPRNFPTARSGAGRPRDTGRARQVPRGPAAEPHSPECPSRRPTAARTPPRGRSPPGRPGPAPPPSRSRRRSAPAVRRRAAPPRHAAAPLPAGPQTFRPAPGGRRCRRGGQAPPPARPRTRPPRMAAEGSRGRGCCGRAIRAHLRPLGGGHCRAPGGRKPGSGCT